MKIYGLVELEFLRSINNSQCILNSKTYVAGR